MYKLALPVLVLFSTLAFADITIIDVRKNIPMSDSDPSYTDFYLSAGASDGMKKNLVVTVFRSMAVRDASGAQSFGEIGIPVGQVKVIAVYDKVSVAREYKLLSRDVNPMLEQIGLMSGDKVELSNSFVDNSASKRKPQAVAETETTPASTVTTITATTVTTTPAATAPQATPQVAPTAPQASAQVPASPLAKVSASFTAKTPASPTANIPAVAQPLPVQKQASTVAPATSPLPQAAATPVATKMIVPDEVTKTAQGTNSGEASSNTADTPTENSVPGALLQDGPVDNTPSPETL